MSAVLELFPSASESQFAPARATSIPIVVVVYGTPATQGSKKFVGMSKMGRAILVDDNKRNKPWRESVKLAALAARNGAEPLDCPLRLRVVFTLPKPASAPKRRRIYPKSKPDLSKLIRSAEDALTDSGMIRDDSRIVEYSRLAKVFPGEDPEALDCPGVRIVIEVIAA